MFVFWGYNLRNILNPLTVNFYARKWIFGFVELINQVLISSSPSVCSGTSITLVGAFEDEDPWQLILCSRKQDIREAKAGGYSVIGIELLYLKVYYKPFYTKFYF